MWLKAPNISCLHGFSTRHGGWSAAPFDTLNLGGSEDDPELVRRNRETALRALSLSLDELALLRQVHGTAVCEGAAGFQEGDALVTSKKRQALAVSIADCYPVLFHDPENHVIGAAHAGWRGTAAGIVLKVLDAMKKKGARTGSIQVAIGQGISKKNFEVGPEVIETFRNAGFPDLVFDGRHIDLVSCNRWLLEQAGIGHSKIWSMDRCTFEPDFFSFRRDKGVTGRMWGLIMLN